MTKKNTFLILFSLFYLFNFSQKTTEKLIDYVNPFIGTGGHGHTFPGATLPFGMVQLSPDNGVSGWDWCSGYHYSSNTIAGFSHTHLSGTGIGDFLDISFMPLNKEISDTITTYKQTFSHENEIAKPGYYSVLLDNKIKAELTSTLRNGFHRYSFPKESNQIIKIDLGFERNWDKTTQSYFKKIDDFTIAGYRYSEGWAKNQKVFFVAKFSKKIKNIKASSDGKSLENQSENQSIKNIIHLFFDPNNQIIETQVAISFNSLDGAFENLKEAKNQTFNQVKENAQKIWENELSKIKVETKNKNDKTIFYTSVYHTLISPNLYSDLNGKYRNAKDEFHASQSPRYHVFSLWDTFRSVHPLYTLTQKNKVPELINSMLMFYEENGLLPVWDISSWEANTMTGYHAIPVIAEAIIKDFKGFDYNKALQAMIKSANQNQRGTQEYIKYGYIPQDKHGWSVTMTLEYAYDDWCIAQVAKKLGNNKIYDEFIKRSENYKNLFDDKTNFHHAKNSEGKWIEPFDSFHSEHEAEGQYIEGTAWQHTFFVPHDVKNLAKLYKKSSLENHLDSLFIVSSKMNGKNVSPDVSGFIGQYAHGNEPSHHIAYMYNHLNKPRKTQAKVREIIEKMYHNNPDGLSGNEDCGQMSAWYVLSSIGLYSMNPASGNFEITSPIFDKITINSSKKPFIINVKRLNKNASFIKSMNLNGKNHKSYSIDYKEINNGGTLDFILE